MNMPKLHFFDPAGKNQETEKGFVNFLIEETNFYRTQLLTVVRKTKLFAHKYPKMILLLLCILAAYYLFNNELFSGIVSHLGTYRYVGEFIGGLLFSFGFTTPFAMAIFLRLTPDNVILASVIGGCGALISDLIIFKFIKFSFEDEFRKLKRERPFLFMKKNILALIHPKLFHYLTFAFAGFLFASPLPDEAAVIVLAGISKINVKALAVASFVCNTIGIFLLLSV